MAGLWCPEGPSMRVAQRISTSLHRESARAILRRVPDSRGPVATVPDLGEDSDSDEDAEGGGDLWALSDPASRGVGTGTS